MTELKEYQAFSPVTRPDGMPSDVLLIYLATLVAVLGEIQSAIEAHDARLSAGGL